VSSTKSVQIIESERTGKPSVEGGGESEIEKWKKFGYLVAESYDELKKEHEKVKQES